MRWRQAQVRSTGETDLLRSSFAASVMVSAARSFRLVVAVGSARPVLAAAAPAPARKVRRVRGCDMRACTLLAHRIRHCGESGGNLWDLGGRWGGPHEGGQEARC